MKLAVRTNLAAGVLIVIVTLLVILMIPLSIPGTGAGVEGARLVPRGVMVIAFLSGLWLIIEDFINMARQKEVEYMDIDVTKELRILAGMCILILYSLLMSRLGFIISSTLAAGGLMALLKTKKWHYYLIVFAAVILVYFMFERLLLVQLP